MAEIARTSKKNRLEHRVNISPPQTITVNYSILRPHRVNVLAEYSADVKKKSAEADFFVKSERHFTSNTEL
jgi:hypothetical protein